MQLKKENSENSDLLIHYPGEVETPSFISHQPKKPKQFGFLFWLILFFTGGILAAIFLPTQLSCGNKARQSEGKQNVLSTNRYQQAYYIEKGKFTDSWTELGVGIKTQTNNYNYAIRKTETYAYTYGLSRQDDLKSYVGAVFLVPASKGEMITTAIVCETVKPGKTQPTDPILQNSVPTCGINTVPVNR